MKKLLVVVDMQNDFVYGVLGTKEATEMLPALKALLARERAAGTELAFTLDTHGENYGSTLEGRNLPVPHCIKGTSGWEIVSELKEYTVGARLFEKGAFGSLALAEYARDGGYGELALCGVCTNICVVSNALLLKAYCPETPVRVYSRACAGTMPDAHAAALTTLKSCQVIVE